MVSRDYQALARRARELAERYPASREGLLFYAGAIVLDWPALREYALATGPAPLAAAAREFDSAGAVAALAGGGPAAFFARLVIGRSGRYPSANGPCPRCGQPPQAGCLRASGDGSALALVCSLCPQEWAHTRSRCAACGAGEIGWYSAAGFEHVQVMNCESCRRYLHVIDLGREPGAIAEVDEMAALPLDVWARERGYRKVCANLLGI